MKCFTPERIVVLFGRIFPAWEYELVDGERTGRRRRTQFTARYPEMVPWEEPSHDPSDR